MPKSRKTRLRYRIWIASLPVVVLAGMYVAGILGASTDVHNKQQTPSTVALLSPLMNTFEIANYTVTDPGEHIHTGNESWTSKLYFALKNAREPLNSKVDTSGKEFPSTINQCNSQRASFDIVWVREIDDEKTGEMILELYVTVVSVGT